ncbi:MAG: choice-of-anchor Q domain-containing protein, partial [Thermoguttaceae bacterium]
LGPLAANGGPTETMALLSGSPALEAGGPITTLTNGIDNQVTQFQVADAAVIASTALSWPIQIDGEQMTVTGVDLASKTLTVQRATAGSAAGHNANAGVYFAYDQRGDAVVPPVPDIGACQTPPPPANSLTISVPASMQAGTSFPVTIKAYYAPGKIAWNDQDTLTLTSSDKEMKSMQVPLVNGQASPSVTLDKVTQSATFTVSDKGSFKTTSSAISIYGARPVSGTLTASPTSVTAGKSVTVTMSKALDTYGNPANGIVTLVANDNPNEGTGGFKVTNGQGSGSVTLTLVKKNIKEQAYAGDSVTGTLVASTGVITVNPAGASQLAVSSKHNATAGSSLSVTLTAQDQYGNTASNSGWDGKGNVSFSTTNGGAVTAPATAQFSGGVATASIKLSLASAASFMLNVSATRPPKHGSPTLTVTGFEWLTVGPGPVAKFLVAGPSSAPVGTPFPVTITAEDADNNVVTDYNKALQFSTTPSQPVTENGNISWSSGVGTASLTLEAAGSVTVTASIGSGNKLIKGTTKSTITITPDWFSNNVPDAGLQALAREDYLANGGQVTSNPPGDTGGSLSYNNWLGLFQQAETASTISATVLTSLQALAANKRYLSIPDSVANLANKALGTDAGNAYYHPLVGGLAQNQKLGNLKAGAAKTQLQHLVNKWFLGVDYPNSEYTLGEYNPATSTPTYQLVNAPGAAHPVPLRGPDESANNINYYDASQGAIDDGWVLAPLAAVAQQDPAAIYNMFTDNGNGTYTVRFYNTAKGAADYVTVDTELPGGGSGAFDNIQHLVPGDQGIAQFTNLRKPIYIPASPPSGTPYYFSELWVALYEKAYCQENVEGWLWSNSPGTDGYFFTAGIGYEAINGPGYSNFSAAAPAAVLSAITGHSATGVDASDPVALGTDWQGGQPAVVDAADKLVLETGMNIASTYAVVGYDSSSELFTLFSPWGLNGESHIRTGQSAPSYYSGVVTLEATLVTTYCTDAAYGSSPTGCSAGAADVSGVSIAVGSPGGSLAGPGAAQRAALGQWSQPAAPLAAAHPAVNRLAALDAALASDGIAQGHHKLTPEGDKLSKDRIDALLAANDLSLAASLNP